MEQIVDTALSLARKRRALASGAAREADFLAQRAAGDLADRLSTVTRSFDDGAALFCLTDDATQALAISGKVGHVRRIEADPMFGSADIAPPEIVPAEPETLDLVASLMTLHEVNDLPGMLVQVRRALRPDGLFLGAMAGAGTLDELRQSLLAAEVELSGGASPRVMPFADVRDIGALLQRAGFALPVADLETVTVRYDHMFALMADLRAMGATNALVARSRRPASRALFARAAQIYEERFSDPDGRIRATFSIIWMSGWAPHASQQKPLARGSATTSLAEALKPN